MKPRRKRWFFVFQICIIEEPVCDYFSTFCKLYATIFLTFHSSEGVLLLTQNEFQLYYISGLKCFTTLGIKKELINKSRESRLFQPQSFCHSPLLQTSVMVAKKNVITNPPASMPKNVPQKNCAKLTFVKAIPKSTAPIPVKRVAGRKRQIPVA